MVSTVQSQVLGVMQTGYPIVDAVITTLIVCVFSAMVTYGRSMFGVTWHRARRMLGLDGCSITIKRQDVVPRSWYDEHIMNLDYQALVWYMTTVMRPANGHMTSLYLQRRDAKDEFEEVFLPAKRQVVDVNFKGVGICMYTDCEEFRDDKAYRICNERIVVCSRNCAGVAPLRDFLEHVRTSHMAHQKNQSWRQRLFRLKRDVSDTKKGLVWAGALTHSSKTFDTVVLDSPVKAALVADFHNYLRSEEWYRTMGLSYKRGYMFYGPPGTGKTSLVLALASEGKRDIYSLDLSKMNSDADLDQAFEQLPDTCLVVLEDVDAMGTMTHSRVQQQQQQQQQEPPVTTKPNAIVDALLAASGVDDSSQRQGVSLSALLNHLDGVGSNHGRIFVLTTNHPEVLDPALVRPGRVDMKICMGLCSQDQLRQFFVLYFDADPALMDCVPEDVLSPADVSSCFQHFRGQPDLAVAELRRLAAKRVQEIA
jgi:hypothetical protein